MKTLNENQKDILGTVVALSLFWIVMGYFTATQPNYASLPKAPQIEAKHVQSPVLEKYGELITNNK
jgi:uncharacterized protein YneF (UPF0154 family)